MIASAPMELVAAQLPDPGHPSVVAFGAAIGVWWGGGCGLLIWATACVTTFLL